MLLQTSRILHCVGLLHRGGIESWLLNILDFNDASLPQMDFVLTKPVRGELEDEFSRRGCNIYHFGGTRMGLSFPLQLAQLLRERRHIAVHSHVHHFNGVVLSVAAMAGVRHRFSHSHNDTHQLDLASSRYRRFYTGAMTKLINRYSTAGIAVSEQAAGSLFGKSWKDDDRWEVIPCGIDVSRIRNIRDSQKSRKDLGIPESSTVFMHVGRLCHQKNQLFLLKIFSRLIVELPLSTLVLIGAGEDEKRIRTYIQQEGLERHVLLLGSQPEAIEIMNSFADVFVFPSKYEGLGLAAIEAQALGIPTVLSGNVPREAIVNSDLVTQLSLDSSINDWACSLIQASKKRRIDRDEALRLVDRSRVDIASSIDCMASFYSRRIAG